MFILLGMGMYLEVGIYCRGEFFDQVFGIFLVQIWVGNGLIVSEWLIVDDFLCFFVQEIFCYNFSNCCRVIVDLLINIFINF